MLDSIHTARWLENFKDQGIDFYLFPSTPNRRVHSQIKNLISNAQSQTSSFRLSPFAKWAAIPMWGADMVFGNRIRGYLVARTARKVKATHMHAMELNHAGKISTKALKNLENLDPKVISTVWGSDIFWFGQFKKHQGYLTEILTGTDLLVSECIRDLELAKNLGFKGGFSKSETLFGFADSQIEKERVPASKRNLILIKGYESFVGRASIAIKAAQILSKDLDEFDKSRLIFINIAQQAKINFGEIDFTYADAIYNLADIAFLINDFDSSLYYFNIYITIKKNLLGSQHPDFAVDLENVGYIYQELGDYQAAEKYYKESLEISKKELGKQDHYYANILQSLGILYRMMGNYEASESHLKQSLEIVSLVYGKNHNKYADVINELGLLYTAKKDYANAFNCVNEKLKISDLTDTSNSTAESIAIKAVTIVMAQNPSLSRNQNSVSKIAKSALEQAKRDNNQLPKIIANQVIKNKQVLKNYI